MDAPERNFPFAEGLTICRLLNGLWQVSGAHGRIDPSAALNNMIEYHDSGYTTWDLADHYGPAEDFIGEFRKRLADERGEAELARVQAFTKWVPRPGAMTREIVENNVDISLRRMGVDCLDLLQFHWWDYGDNRYLEALGHLSDLRQAGKIRHLALTNFDTVHLRIIVENGIEVVSNQVQFSLVDMRPAQLMAPFCQANGIHLLAYGAFCGGLLSQRYLGTPEPRGRGLGHGQPRQVQADGGRLGRLGPVSGVAGPLEGGGCQARLQHFQRGQPLRAGPAGRSRGNRRGSPGH